MVVMLLKGRTGWYFFYGEARNGAYAEGRHGPRNGDFEDDMVVWKIVLGVDGGLSGGLSLPFPKREAVGLCYEARELGDRAGVWNEDTFVIEADLGGRELFVRVVRRGAVGGGERGERGGRGDVCGHDGGGDERRDDEPEPSSLGGASGRVAGRSTIAKHLKWGLQLAYESARAATLEGFTASGLFWEVRYSDSSEAIGCPHTTHCTARRGQPCT